MPTTVLTPLLGILDAFEQNLVLKLIKMVQTKKLKVDKSQINEC
jgi:hypothetical protein